MNLCDIVKERRIPLKSSKKIFAVILALIMVTAVFTSCGSNDKTLLAASFLAGDWETSMSTGEFDVPLMVTFNADGTATMSLPEDKYNQFINNMVDTILKEEGFFDLSDDQKEIAFEEMGVAHMDEAKKVFANMLTEEIPYEELKADYIIPSPFDKRVCSVVAKEVGRVAREQGIAKA